MSNPYEMKQTDFNAATGKGIKKTLETATVYFFEGLKGAANLVKHLIMTFMGK